MGNAFKGAIMYKKRYLFLGLLILLLSSLLYFQYGRKITVYGSSIHTSKDYAKVEINIVANKLFIENKEKYARKILKEAENNQLPRIKLSITNPEELVLRIYKSNEDWENNIGFTVTYYPETEKLVLEI